MKKLNCKLIVSDFDGTLIDDNQRVLPQVREEINKYVENGGIFAVCTGRMLRSILPQVRDLGLKGLVIANQGSIIAEIESGKLIKRSGMQYTEIAEICNNIEELGQNVNVYADNDLYSDIPKDNEYLQTYERIIGVETIFVQGKMSDFITENKIFAQKVSVLIAPEEREKLFEELKRRLGTRFDVTCSASVLVEVSPLTDNKGEALKFLAKKYGIPLELTVAAGDNLNDLSMVEVAGVGVAVGNAAPKLKEAAKFVSVTNNEGAIAQIIKKFGYA